MSAFVVIEGPDGVGKSTLARGLRDHYRQHGLTVALHAEPTKSAIGKFARECMALDGEPYAPMVLAMLLVADRANHQRELDADMRYYDVVICDRYALSTLVYQSADMRQRGSLEAFRYMITELWRLHQRWLHGPDVTLVLTGVAPDKLYSRIAQRRAPAHIFERQEHLEVIAHLYTTVQEWLPDQERHNIAMLDASGTPEEVLRRAVLLIEDMEEGFHGKS